MVPAGLQRGLDRPSGWGDHLGWQGALVPCAMAKLKSEVGWGAGRHGAAPRRPRLPACPATTPRRASPARPGAEAGKRRNRKRGRGKRENRCMSSLRGSWRTSRRLLPTYSRSLPRLAV
eukprot:3884290-Rhodomonas_salina.2